MLDTQRTKNKQLVTSTATPVRDKILQTVRCLTCREVIEERADGVLVKQRECRCQRESQ
jgi:hypothetical protein